MKRRVYASAGLLGAAGAVLLGSLILYVWGAFPVRRHPYAHPFSIVCGSIAAVLCIVLLIRWLYYIIKLPRGARVRTIFCCIPMTAVCFIAGLFLFSQSYDMIADIVHRLDP